MTWQLAVVIVVGLVVIAAILLIWIERDRPSKRTRFGFFIERERDKDE